MTSHRAEFIKVPQSQISLNTSFNRSSIIRYSEQALMYSLELRPQSNKISCSLPRKLKRSHFVLWPEQRHRFLSSTRRSQNGRAVCVQ